MNQEPFLPSPTPEPSAAASASQLESGSGQPGPGSEATVSRPRLWPVLAVLLACLIFYAAGSMVAIVLASWAAQGRIDGAFLKQGIDFAAVTRSPLALSITLVLPQIALAIPVLIAAGASPVRLTRRLALVRGSWPIWMWLTAAMGTPLVGMISAAIVGALLGESEVLDELSGVFRSLAQEGYLLPLALMVGITPGVCEELVFRGYMQTRLTARWGAPVGIFSASLVFAIFHMDLVHSVAVLALGIYLGWIAWASGTILPAILAHFLNNFLTVLAVAVLPQSLTGGPPAGADVAPEIPLAAVLGVMGVVMLSGTCLAVTLFHAVRHSRAAAAADRATAMSNAAGADGEAPIFPASPNQR